MNPDAPSREQAVVCRRFGATACPVGAEDLIGLGPTSKQTQWPVNGLRHAPEGGTSGWYIWWGEIDPAKQSAQFFTPVHASHISELFPPVVPYLALPPGWRFLIAPGIEDAWYDADLLDV